MDIRKTVRIPAGHYVAAVSGGVDSVVMLDILAQLNQILPSHPLHITVAHFDHGIRPDSRQDRLLVEQLARQYGLPFVYSEGNLGPQTSEEVARNARYTFLRDVQKQVNASSIITAHHQDDVLETAVHNLLRGTGRKGMSSLKTIDGIMRPFTHLPKQHLIDYATANKLKWREDSSNQDISYRRNYIRHRLLPAFRQSSAQQYDQLVGVVKRQAELNQAIDTKLQTLLHIQPATNTLRRHDVIMLPHLVACELVGEWLRRNGKREFGRKHLERATIILKTGLPGSAMELDKAHTITLTKKTAHIS